MCGEETVVNDETVKNFLSGELVLNLRHVFAMEHVK